MQSASQEPDTGTAARQERSLGITARPLGGIRRLTALDTVRARIALAVDLGLLAPGEWLPRAAEIGEALDVGEITVRRALVSLCTDGILERRRGRAGGTLVAQHPPHGVVREIAAYYGATDDVHRLIDHRVMLECGIAHLAAMRADEAAIHRLQRLVEQMAEAGVWTEFHTLDAHFHTALAEVTGVPAAAEAYRGVLLDLYRYFLPYPIEYLHQSNREHQSLVTAVSERDAVAAVDVARRHVEELHTTMFMGLTERSSDQQ